MELEIYERLRKHLDRLPIGFPKTKSGVEMEILQQLFEPEEAEIACLLDVRPETAEAIAQRLDRDVQTVEESSVIFVAVRSFNPVWSIAICGVPVGATPKVAVTVREPALKGPEVFPL